MLGTFQVGWYITPKPQLTTKRITATMENGSRYNSDLKEDNVDKVHCVSTFRRILPQCFATLARDVISTNIGEYFGFIALLIPALTGLNEQLNPNETIEITANQASWLPSFVNMMTPVGSLLGGPLSDAIGRKNALILVTLIYLLGWIILGFSESYLMICMIFLPCGFLFGLSEAPATAYVTEISEPSVRGLLMSSSIISIVLGVLISMTLGLVFSWRQVAFICALFSVANIVAILLVPESPHWLISKGRTEEAQKSLQWLRGWVPPQTVYKEFIDLQNYNNTSNACAECSKKSIKCCHPKPTLCDKIKDLKQKRTIQPFVFVFSLVFFGNLNLSPIWEPYIVQICNAFKTPIKPTYASVLSSVAGVLGSIFLILTVRKLGRRTIFLTAISIVAICCFGLSIYGLVLLPPGWTSFKKDNDEQQNHSENIMDSVGNYSYIALTFILVIKFCGKAGMDLMWTLYVCEVFPFKSRSFICGIATSWHFLLTLVASKTYYNIESWLSLPGATTFYGIISVIGFVVMYLIMPETEQRSLEDIERHYSDKTKGLTDIYIRKQTKVVQMCVV